MKYIFILILDLLKPDDDLIISQNIANNFIHLISSYFGFIFRQIKLVFKFKTCSNISIICLIVGKITIFCFGEEMFRFRIDSY